ncbi:MAG: hypothetical protein QXQ02_01380 [Halobacteria archaeon]
MSRMKIYGILVLISFFFCTVEQPLKVPTEDMEIKNQIDKAKKEAEENSKENGFRNEEYPINFILDYSGRTVLDSGNLRSNKRTMVEHLKGQYWKGGIIEGDIIGVDTLTQYSHWVHYAADSIPDRYWRHANCFLEISYDGGNVLPMHAFWSYREPPNYAYGWNFGAMYKDEANKILWIIEAMIEADQWDALMFRGEGKLKKFLLN